MKIFAGGGGVSKAHVARVRARPDFKTIFELEVRNSIQNRKLILPKPPIPDKMDNNTVFRT